MNEWNPSRVNFSVAHRPMQHHDEGREKGKNNNIHFSRLAVPRALRVAAQPADVVTPFEMGKSR